MRRKVNYDEDLLEEGKEEEKVEEEFEEVEKKSKKQKKEIVEEEEDDEEDNDKVKQISNSDKEQLEEQEADRVHRVSQQIVLNHYIFKRKLSLSALVLAFSLSLCCLYIGSYLLASRIYNDSLEDFSLLTLMSDRTPCIARSFFLSYYQIVQNKTEDPIEKVLEQCMQVENEVRQVRRQGKAAYEQISGLLETVDSN